MISLLDGRLVLRIAIGNLRTTRRHVEIAWELIRKAAAEAAGSLWSEG